MNLSSLKNLSQRNIAIIVIVVTLFAVLLWYFYMYQPKVERAQGLQEEIALLDTEIARGQAAQRNLPALRLAVLQSEEDRRNFLEQLPLEEEVAALLDQIRLAAVASGTQFESITFGGAAQQGAIMGVLPLNYVVSTAGTYASNIAFLQTLETLRRFTRIENISFSPSEQGVDEPPLSATYNFTVYVFTGDDPGETEMPQ